MADMADLKAGAPARPGIGHVDGHGLLNAPAAERSAEGAVASHLLGHAENLQPVPVGLPTEQPGIGLDSIEVENVRVGRDCSSLMKRDRLLDQAGIAAAEHIQKHLNLSGPFHEASGRSRRG
jgi:hypothetical protein